MRPARRLLLAVLSVLCCAAGIATAAPAAATAVAVGGLTTPDGFAPLAETWNGTRWCEPSRSSSAAR
jgi:hypothetical protein